MDMFLKMYNVKMFLDGDGTQTWNVAAGSRFFFKAQSVRTRSKWLLQSVVVATLPYPESDEMNKTCQTSDLSKNHIFRFIRVFYEM